jgi:hypothetical protein
VHMDIEKQAEIFLSGDSKAETARSGGRLVPTFHGSAV